MKNSIKPAFPTQYYDDGLTKREYFAGLAMQAELTNPSGATIKEAAAYIGIEEKDYIWQTHYPILVAKKALAHADELLKQLENE
jgi:hypothetical protein